jgi:tRNA C32,U32 (ribose-2'-O)-methylase TrmJ
VESYRNLESKLAPQSRELKELKKMVQKIQESTTPKEEDPFSDLPQEQKEAISLLEKIVARQLDKRLSPLVQQAEVEQAKSKIQAVKQTYPDISDAEIESALDVMEKYPRMELSEAVKLVSFDKTYQKATSLSKKAASTQQNRKAFAESASEARQGDELDYSKMTLEELEKIIPKG